jgi:hypothetical protein
MPLGGELQYGVTYLEGQRGKGLPQFAEEVTQSFRCRALNSGNSGKSKPAHCERA